MFQRRYGAPPAERAAWPVESPERRRLIQDHNKCLRCRRCLFFTSWRTSRSRRPSATSANSTARPAAAAANKRHNKCLRCRRLFHLEPSALRDLREFYACGLRRRRLPSDWRSTWDKPRQWGLTGNKNWATKYAAAGFIPRMIDRSPFVTSDWRSASASVVVLFARQYAGGPAIVQQQCLQRLRERSPSFAATNGSRHFFIFTDSRGPCCLDGKYKDVGFLNHHVIGPHGEPQREWFFRRGKRYVLNCLSACTAFILLSLAALRFLSLSLSPHTHLFFTHTHAHHITLVQALRSVASTSGRTSTYQRQTSTSRARHTHRA